MTSSNKRGDQLSLSQRAYEQIKNDVITCKLQPGIDVSEAHLAARCRLGKAPVRAALARLSQEGLVKATPRRGYQIAPITLRDIHDLFDLRVSLESMATRLATGKVSTARLRAINKEWSEGYQKQAGKVDPGYLEANKRFHLTIAEASGNGRLVQILGRLLDETDRLIYLGLPLASQRQEIQEGHTPLIEALERGDADAAEKIAVEHVLAAKAIRIDTVMSNSSLMEANISIPAVASA